MVGPMPMLMTLSIVVLSVAAAAAQTPVGWEQTSSRTSDWMRDGRAAEAIALLERTAAQSPGFADAEFELANAHYFRARELAKEGTAQDAPRRRHLRQAATLYLPFAGRNGVHHEPAIRRLLLIYDDDELDLPDELAAVARQYIAIDPRSTLGHVTLAEALRRSGRKAEAWTALDAATTAVAPDDAPNLARVILALLLGAIPPSQEGGVATTPAAPKELARLLAFVDKGIAHDLATDPSERSYLLGKALALQLRAQRLEPDPVRRRALEAEAKVLIANADRQLADRPATRRPR
jgi:hypothetical protein